MRAFLRAERWGLLVVALLALVMQVLEYRGWLGGLEGRLLDTLLASGGQVRGESPITLVDIDDEAYAQCFGETSPMDAAVVAALVAGVAREGQPWVIGVDVLTDSRKFATQYRALAPQMEALKPKVVWISGVASARFELASFLPWLAGAHHELIVKPTPVLGFEPGELAGMPELVWGVPVFPLDEDAGVRRFPRTVELSADPRYSSARERHSTWARRVAEEYCRSGARCADESAEEVLISYAAPTPKRVRALELFQCSEGGALPQAREGVWEKFREGARGKIVMIGGTFRASGDFHDTPAGRIDGLLINAYAVQAEADAAGIREASRPLAVLFDLATGVLMVWAGYRMEQAVGRMRKRSRWRGLLARNLIRWTMAMSAGVVLLAAGCTWLLFGRGYLLSFLGVGVGVMLHQIAEVWQKNPRMELKPEHGRER